MTGEMTTVARAASAEFTEKRSVFIGHTASVSDAAAAEAFIASVKKKYSDARHNVWAYLLRDGSMRYSDDGEPQGTGGVPVLEVLKKSGLCNVAVVVTRYFGGILLGAGGLSRAYSKAATMAIAEAGTVTYSLFTECLLSCDYGEYRKLMYEMEKYDIIIDNTVFENDVKIYFSVNKNEAERLISAISAATNAKRNAEIIGERFDIPKKQA